MDWYYKPETRQYQKTDIRRCPRSKGRIADHAKQETGDYVVQLDETAPSRAPGPTRKLLSQVSLGRNLTTDDVLEGLAQHV